VLVRPKEGILDPQGQAVADALRHLGFRVDDARVGRLVELEFAGDDPAHARAELGRMCDQLLANPLIETYEIVALDGSSANAETAGAPASHDGPGASA
jgi:phosphoribosylformylglycinamidine synthase